MTLPPPHSTRIDTLVPYTTLFRATAMNRWARQHRFTRATSRPPRRRAVAWSIALLVVALVACIGLAGGVRAAPAADLWDRWTVSDQSSQASIDHAAWDHLLKTYVIPGKDGNNRFAYRWVTAADAKDRTSTRLNSSH